MQHKTKEDYVADFVREAIVAGRFPRGAKLRQAELAAMIGTSITPVREALKLLEAEGFVIGMSHRGAVVAPFDMQSGQEIVDLRTLLESRLAIAAAERLTPRDIAELQEHERAYEAAGARGDREGARAANYRFHAVIYAAAEQPLTLSFVRVLWARYPFDLINLVDGRFKRAAHEHKLMVQSLISGDATTLLSTLSDHIRSGWDEICRAGRMDA